MIKTSIAIDFEHEKFYLKSRNSIDATKKVKGVKNLKIDSRKIKKPILLIHQSSQTKISFFLLFI